MTARRTIGPKGQVMIPKDLRERYHLMEGEDVVDLPAQKGVLIKHTPSALRGRLKGKLYSRMFQKDVRVISKECSV